MGDTVERLRHIKDNKDTFLYVFQYITMGSREIGRGLSFKRGFALGTGQISAIFQTFEKTPHSNDRQKM